jgi:hypothetical protein
MLGRERFRGIGDNELAGKEDKEDVRFTNAHHERSPRMRTKMRSFGGFLKGGHALPGHETLQTTQRHLEADGEA